MFVLSLMHTAIIIGSGFSGICMAIKLKEKGLHDFIILEKANEVGGTWRDNTYPGAECDIPSALYSYSFEQYPHWEFKWSHQPQILDYLKHCATKYDIYKHIEFGKELVGAKWDSDNSTWSIVCKDGSNYEGKTFITALGQLHHPSTPDLKGKSIFQGPSFHSAQWDHSVDLNNKRIGVIGNAASAVQFIPQLAKVAKQVTIFQRSANWMLPKQDRMYKEWEKKLVAWFPAFLRFYRNRIWLLGGALFLLMKSGNNLMRNFYQGQTKRFIRKHIKDKTLQDKLIPHYPLGARRVLFSDDYYPALAQDNVILTNDPIDSITQKGVQTKNQTDYEFDLIVYGTGFKTNPFLMGLDIRGKDNLSIQEAWKDGPRNYLGMVVDGFPNMFQMYGPNTNLGHNSIIIMSEAQANYITQCVERIKSSNTESIEIKKAVIDRYHLNTQERLKEMIWGKVDQSWYMTANGDLPNNWPGRTMEYMRRTKKVNFGNYDLG